MCNSLNATVWLHASGQRASFRHLSPFPCKIPLGKGIWGVVLLPRFAAFSRVDLLIMPFGGEAKQSFYYFSFLPSSNCIENEAMSCHALCVCVRCMVPHIPSLKIHIVSKVWPKVSLFFI